MWSCGCRQSSQVFWAGGGICFLSKLVALDNLPSGKLGLPDDVACGIPAVKRTTQICFVEVSMDAVVNWGAWVSFLMRMSSVD